MANRFNRATAAMLDQAQQMGNLTGDSTYTQRGTVTTDRLFKFSLSRSSSMKLSLGELSSNADMRLLNERGKEVQRSTQANQRSESISRRLEKGNYYIQVSGVGGSANYKLNVESSGRSIDPGDELRDALDTGVLSGASRSHEGRVRSRDQDFYRFDLSEVGNVRLSLRNLKRDIDLMLLDENGDEIARSMNNDNSEESLNQALNAGTYFVKVSRFGSSRRQYTLEMAADGSISSGNSGGSGGGSSNGSIPSGAELVSSSFSRSAQVGGGDRENTYRFSVGKSGIFSADVTGLAGNSTVRLVQDANNNGAIDAGEVLSSNKTMRRFLNGGTYFLQVASDNRQALSYKVNTGFDEVSSTSSAIRVTRTNRTNADGLSELQVALFRNGKLTDSLIGVSGQPTKQNFRTAEISKAGSAEPLPEGYWMLGDVEWASGVKGDESKSWADPPYDGVGPVWVNMNPSYATERSAIGFHLDNNSYLYPGTVGCVGILNKTDLRRFVSWFDSDAPKVAIVDWGLGTVEV